MAATILNSPRAAEAAVAADTGADFLVLSKVLADEAPTALCD